MKRNTGLVAGFSRFWPSSGFRTYRRVPKVPPQPSRNDRFRRPRRRNRNLRDRLPPATRSPAGCNDSPIDRPLSGGSRTPATRGATRQTGRSVPNCRLLSGLPSPSSLIPSRLICRCCSTGLSKRFNRPHRTTHTHTTTPGFPGKRAENIHSSTTSWQQSSYRK